MEAEKSQEDQEGGVPVSSTAAIPVAPAAVQGVPWWGGVGHQQVLQTAPSSSPTAPSLHIEHPSALMTSMGPVGFALPPPAQQTAALPEGIGVGINGETQPHIGAPAVIPTGVRDYVHPHTQLELGHTMASAAYPYADPYFGGMVTAYGTHAMMYPHMLGIHQSRMPLPSEMTEEEPVYVNAKQYNGIMRRRQSRAKAESENKLVKARKPYLHESRHLHAMRRARGCGGRFLNTKGDTSKASSDSTKSSDGHSSQGGTTPDSKNAGRTDQGFKSCAMQEVQCMENPINGSFALGKLDQGGYCHPAVTQGDQSLHESVLHPRMNDDGNSGKSGAMIAKKSQQRVAAMQ